MKKEESRDDMEEEIKQTQSLKYLLVIFAVIVLIFGAFAFTRILLKPKTKTIDDLFEESLENPDENAFVYNGFSFVRIQGLWYTRIKKPKTGEIFTIPLHFSPIDTKDVIVSGDIYSFAAHVESLNKVYISFNPYEQGLSYVALANSELSASLIQAIGINPTITCDRFQEGVCENTELINCTNTDDPVIYLTNQEHTSVVLEGNCLILKGKDLELTKAMNRFLYTWFGVM